MKYTKDLETVFGVALFIIAFKEYILSTNVIISFICGLLGMIGFFFTVKGIEDEPNNMRYYFYLANSYFDAGHKNKSIPYYKKRIELGGWYQEVWYSHYRLGLAYESSQPELAIFHWLQCTQIMPHRLENIYEIIKFFSIINH